MQKTLGQLQKEIEDLVARAEKLRDQERPAIIERIKADIETFELSPKELFGGAIGGRLSKLMGRPAGRGEGTKKRSRSPLDASAAKYSDSAGNTWVGRGKRPGWLRAALAAGRSLSDFEAGAARNAPDTSAATSTPAANGESDGKGVKRRRTTGGTRVASKKTTNEKSGTPKAKASAKTSARAGVAYKDDAGNSWSGRGPRPKWLKAAVASGKSIEEFAAS